MHEVPLSGSEGTVKPPCTQVSACCESGDNLPKIILFIYSFLTGFLIWQPMASKRNVFFPADD